MQLRADDLLVRRGLVHSRSQAANLIKLGKVWIAARQVHKPGQIVYESNAAEIKSAEVYVSRAGFKLASVATALKLNFKDKIVLDIGSSTGGFTDYAIKHGAKKVIAVDVGTNQLHPTLQNHPRIELHEQTDIRHFVKGSTFHIDIALIDVSFISLRDVLPSLHKFVATTTVVAAMVKPQFEVYAEHGRDAGKINMKNKGVIKNDTMRREVLKDFENWVQKLFKVIDKADSEVAGAKGNQERFYLLKALKTPQL